MTELQRETDGPYQKDGKEYVDFQGETLEIIPPVPDTDFSKLTPNQSIAVQELYKIVSRLLPLEGRDYGMKISFPHEDDPSRPSVKFDPKTELGILWCQYLSQHLPEEVRKLQG
jgi:hypothetical protein